MPMTFGMAMRSLTSVQKRPPRPGTAPGRGEMGGRPTPPYASQVLAGVDDLLDPALLLLRLAHERLDVHDALALLAGDLRPVVGVRRVRQVLVLLELLADRRVEVRGRDALLAAADVALERELLGAAHDGLDHRARGEVLEVQDLLVAVGVRDLEEAVALAQRVHGLDGGHDHRVDRRRHVAAAGHVLGGLFLGLHEDLADLALGLADVLVQQLRALDVEEEALDFLAARLRDLLGEVVRDGLGDHRLAAAGRAVEQHALRRRELVLPVVLGVEVRQLDGVLDRLDLLAEAADIVVADVRHLLEREVLDLALGQLLEQVARLRVHQDVVAGLQAQRPERVGDDADLLLVGAQRDDRALLVELLLQDHDVALDLVARRLDDVQPLVQDQLLAGPERLGLDGRVEVDLHLAALRQDVDGAVLVDREVDAVRRGRRAELVDLLLEGGDLLPRLVEGVDELLVLVERLHELAVGLAQLVLEDHEVLRRVLELLPEVDGLRLERADVGLQVLHLDLVLGQAAARARVGHGRGEELREPLAAGATLLVELLHSPSLLT